MRSSLRRTERGTERVFTLTWVVLALMLGMLGLRYRKSSALAHAAARGGAPAQQAQPGAKESGHAPLPAKPANDRDG